MSETANLRTPVPTAPGNTDAWLERRSDPAALAVLTVGLALRIRAASGTFLNPDEALHYFIANRGSWSQVYQAGLTMAHPPLLFFVLYLWRQVGTSEFVLRLPSVFAGTAFCWIFFKWMTAILGRTPAWIGLIFVTLLPPMVALSAEVRQYELLLLFAVSAAYFLEKALAKNSINSLLFSFVCLYLAMLSHYSGFLFAAALGIYSLWRVCSRAQSIPLRATWIAGQMGGVGLGAALYVSHIARIRGTTMAEGAFETWLYKSYFHRGQNPLTFALARSFSTFQYLLGQRLIGVLMALAFVAGIAFLLRGRILLPKASPTAGQLVALLILPFAINCGLALLGVYPYGGTRHCVFLIIFAVAGVAVFLSNLAQERIVRGIAFALVVVLCCLAFPSTFHPYIRRADHSEAHMQKALAFVREQIPTSAPILVDYETGMLLGYYLCQRRPISFDESLPGFLMFQCGGHRIISTGHDLWFLTPQNFRAQCSGPIQTGQFRPGENIWVGQAGFNVTLEDDLQRESADFHAVQTHAFGKNIRLFSVTVQ